MGNSVDNRGKVIPLADQLYVSPYLLRPLRRLEEVEGDAGKRAADKEGAGDRAGSRAVRGQKPHLRPVEKS